MKLVSVTEAVACRHVCAKIDDVTLQSRQPGSNLIQYFPHLTDTMCHSLRSIYISQIEYIIELALFVTSQSGLLSGNPDQFRTILLKKVRFRTKVREIGPFGSTAKPDDEREGREGQAKLCPPADV